MNSDVKALKAQLTDITSKVASLTKATEDRLRAAERPGDTKLHASLSRLHTASVDFGLAITNEEI